MSLFCEMTPIFSYFDPGSGSLVLQALVGGTAGLFVFAKYVWSAGPGVFFNKRSRNLPAAPRVVAGPQNRPPIQLSENKTPATPLPASQVFSYKMSSSQQVSIATHSGD